MEDVVVPLTAAEVVVLGLGAPRLELTTWFPIKFTTTTASATAPMIAKATMRTRNDPGIEKIVALTGRPARGPAGAVRDGPAYGWNLSAYDDQGPTCNDGGKSLRLDLWVFSPMPAELRVQRPWTKSLFAGPRTGPLPVHPVAKSSSEG